ncbi:TPR repeat-containing protein [Lacticaseibacillus pantheris DSM 15945 = JCM 12539 = NBRC 106106]|uniref:TPR repeat-containing protein n=1 Tax=Lacticaseibacillus pantheris DSM 15945 = JCM 12539 = NBRC 106106 TaxID=1423783 RepID=A0A0R1TWF1_9LACO|nr:tetratricopeptide repeat protein [Lacticaseibacillus pantheris]KRL85511.1 TPR repeat-containing protein [Lacticaseibacillus pantheris DSM 15945 = JCM 12539 = NBRC 106106]
MSSYSAQMLDAIEGGQLERAHELLQLAQTNDDDETQFNLAEELYGIGFTPEAKQLYESLLGKYPDEGDVLTALADIAVTDGDSDAALEYLSRIHPDNPAYVQALLAVADLYQTQGLYEVSAQKLREAAQLAPDEPVITFAQGELNRAWGHTQDAAAAYLRLLDQGEDIVAGVNVRGRYGEALGNLGRYEDAVAVFDDVGVDALTLDETFQLGVMDIELKEYKDATDALQRVVEQDETYTSAYLPLAQAQQAMGDTTGALQTVQAGIAQDDTNADLFALGGTLALDLDDAETGERYFQSALAIDPNNQAHRLDWSNFLLHEGRDQENVDFLGALDEDGNSDPQLYWNLARSQEQLEEYDAARANYLLAFGTFQDRPSFLRDIAQFFRTTAAAAEERAALQRLVQLEPDDVDAQERLDDLNAGA